MTFWKLRTTVSQDGNTMVMEADCRDYLSALSDPIEGDMGFVFSNWENASGSEDFELDYGQSFSGSCDTSKTTIRNFTVKTMGSTEEMPPKPEPQPAAE